MAVTSIAKRKAAVKKYRKRNPAGSYVPLLVIGGAVVAGWWYVNNYGPNGAVKNAAGQKVGLSWWEQWFGTSTTTVAPVQPGAPGGTVTPGGGGATVTPPGPAQPAAPAPPSAPPSAGTSSAYQAAYDKTYQAAVVQNGQDPTRLNIDQWAYYYQQVVGPIDATNADAIISAAINNGLITDRSQPIPLGSFMQLLKNYGNVGLSGMGDLVPVSRWGSAATPVGAGIYSRNRGRRDVN